MTFFTFHGLPTQDLNYDFVYKYSSKNILCKYFERQMYWHYFHVLNLYTLILKFQNFDRTDRRSTFVDRWSVYFLLGSLVLAVQIKKKKKSFRATCKLFGCFFFVEEEKRKGHVAQVHMVCVGTWKSPDEQAVPFFLPSCGVWPTALCFAEVGWVALPHLDFGGIHPSNCSNCVRCPPSTRNRIICRCIRNGTGDCYCTPQ